MSPRTSRADSFDRVEKLGLELPGLRVSTYFGKPALKLDKEMIACIASHKSAEPNTLVVRVDFLERDLRVANEPDVYYIKPHYANYPCVLARLSRVSDSALRDLLQAGYSFATKNKSRVGGRRRSR
jgi:hypothetical protein